MYQSRQEPTGPKKMLALDGGGLRGLISLGVLREIEALLRQHRKNDELVLADEFDYVAGTSTGAIIAAAISLGYSVDRIEQLYVALGPKLFTKRPLLGRIWSLYDSAELGVALVNEFGADTTLGDEKLHTLLLCVLQNASTDSPWPLSNCTGAKYNQRNRTTLQGAAADCNLDLLLWEVVRASAAAPVYFPPEPMTIGAHNFMFQDGGVTSYNNPAFIQFVMATAPAYGLAWPTGPDQLLSVSVGTGRTPRSNLDANLGDFHIKRNIENSVAFLMNSASVEQDRLCRLFGDCRHGARIDREVDSLAGPGAAIAPLFSYVRYNADISQQGLAAMGLGDIKSSDIAKLDGVRNMPDLVRVGEAAGQAVTLDHFAGFIG